MAWHLLKRLKKLNIGGCLSAVINAGGDGTTVTDEAREEIKDLKNLVEENLIYAQREYTFWKDIVQTQENRMERMAQGAAAKNQSDSEQDNSQGTGTEDTDRTAQQQNEQETGVNIRRGENDVIEL